MLPRFVPESPRWLIYQDRSEEAFSILAKYHAEGDRSDPVVMAEFLEIRETIRLEMENSEHSWAEIIRTPANRHRAFIAVCVGLFVQWSGNGLVSYYLAKILATVGITDHYRQNVINVSLQCWNLFTGTSAAFACRYFGRRKQYLFAFIGMTATFACWTGASAVYANSDGRNHEAAAAVVAMIFIYYTFYNAQHVLVFTYTTEVRISVSHRSLQLIIRPLGISVLASR